MTLTELLKACGDDLSHLYWYPIKKEWRCFPRASAKISSQEVGIGSTPEEAVEGLLAILKTK